MKYQRLYDLTLKRGGVTLRVDDYPDSIAMPVLGYATAAGYGTFYRVEGKEQQAFDNGIDQTITRARQLGAEYIGTWVDGGTIYIDPVHVFNSKDYAMGYAHAMNQEAIYDLAHDKTIHRKVK